MDQVITARRRRRDQSRRVSLGIMILALTSGIAILSVFLWQTLLQRDSLLERERDATARMAQVVAAQTEDLFARIRQFFAAADLWLASDPEADPRRDPAFIRLVDDFRQSVDGKIDIRLVSAAGGLYYIPALSDKALADVRDRQYYKAQLAEETRGFVVADPVLSRVTGLWGIPISYPLSSRNGGISVIFAALEEPMLLELYEAIRPKPRGAITLLRGDGTVLARAPFQAEAMGAVAFGSPEEFRAVLTGEAGAIGRDPLIPPDDARHIAAWSRLSHFDLVAVVSSPTEDILAAWRAALPPRLLASLLASGVILAISLWLLSSLKGLSRAREEIASSLDRMRESDALKNRLLSIIAHDLRGPVGATANLLEILEAEGEAMDTEDRSRLLATLRASSASTRQLLENLLEWARLQTEAAVRPPRPTGLQPLVEECVHLLGPSAAAKALALDISVEPGLEARIDAERFRILVRNLLSNAIKFSRIGGRIRLRARAIEGTALIQVEDEGVGMGSSELDRLFAASEGGRSRAGTAGESGSGLGLVLCKDIVEGLGGAIAVESEEGRGTRFSIRLPST